jgi:hypothetical protein
VSPPAEVAEPDEAAIAAYLSNRLDPAHAEAFESYCLTHPEFGRRVELDLYLKVGFEHLDGPGHARRVTHRRRMVMAIAAGLVLILVGGLLLVPREHAVSLLAYRSASEVPAQLLSGPRMSVTLLRLREGSAVHRVLAPRDAKVVAVRIAPDSPAGALGYLIVATVESGMIPHSVRMDQLHANADGYIVLYLPLGSIIGQTLRFAVTPSPSKGAEPLSFQLQLAYAEAAPIGAP